MNNFSYERDRGTPEPMLERAKELISGKQASVISPDYIYKGENLTLRLKEYGYDRKPGESDWQFRKRVFPDFYQQDAGRALEFLMGASVADLDEMDKTLILVIASNGTPSRRELVKFAEGFARDPLERREKMRARQLN